MTATYPAMDATIKLLQAQSLADFECLLVRDGQSEKASEDIACLCDGDKRFKLLALKKTSGLAACFNLGLALAGGDYIQFLLPGDELAPNALQARVSALAKNNFYSVAAMRAPFEKNGAFGPVNYFFKRAAIKSAGGIAENRAFDAAFAAFIERLDDLGFNIIDSPIVDYHQTASDKISNEGGCLDQLPDEIDLLFFAHSPYHASTVRALAPELYKRDISFLVLSADEIYRDEGVRERVAKESLPSLSLTRFLTSAIKVRAIVLFNDWDPIIGRPMALAAKKADIPAIGLVEGVQDYDDVDTGWKRQPYKTVSHVITPCRFDLKYFDPKRQCLYEGAIPRIYNLLREAPAHPYDINGPIVINSNFSPSQALRQKQRAWLQEICSVCAHLGHDYVISRHPNDRGDFSGLPVTTQSMHEAINESCLFISRFSSGILEALAMGRPVIYYNPGLEKADKFTNPRGAYLIAHNKAELAAHIKSALANKASFQAKWPRFLAEHAGYAPEKPERLMGAVADGLEKALLSGAGKKSGDELAGFLRSALRNYYLPKQAGH